MTASERMRRDPQWQAARAKSSLGMACPKCYRPYEHPDIARRECLGCGGKFGGATVEARGI